MMLLIKFTCNICGTTYERKDGKAKIPEGWGAVRPTLRVNMPLWADAKGDKEKEKQWDKLSDVRDRLKRKLWEKEYHICPSCLMISEASILAIEEGKKNEG